MDKEKKAQLVEEMLKKLEESNAVFVFNYQGLNVHNVEDLRRALRETDGEMKVVKNTLARLAFDRANIAYDDDLLKGQNAYAFSYMDSVSVAKVLAEMAKKMPQLEIRGGWLNKSFMGLDEVKQLASLPSRDALIAQVVGGVSSPLTGLIGVLHGVLRQFVWIIRSLEEKKKEEK